MSDSKQWHRHEDGTWHKVEIKGKERHDLKLPDFVEEVKLGIEFTAFTFTEFNNGQAQDR